MAYRQKHARDLSRQFGLLGGDQRVEHLAQALGVVVVLPGSCLPLQLLVLVMVPRRGRLSAAGASRREYASVSHTRAATRRGRH